MAIGVVWTFRRPLEEFIRRAIKIGPTGIEAAPAPDQQRQAPAPPDPRRAADDLLARLDNQYIRQREGGIAAELAARGLTPENPETARVLTRYFAALAVGLEFMFLDSLIRGSQIQMLTALNVRPDAPRDALRVYYDAASGQAPAVFAAYTFDSYLSFLIGQGLVEQRGDRVGITLKGRTFLQFLVGAGRPLQRPF